MYIGALSGIPEKDNQAGNVIPILNGLPERSLIDIVLCYILHDPRFWGPPLLGAAAFGDSIPLEWHPQLDQPCRTAWAKEVGGPTFCEIRTDAAGVGYRWS